MRNSQVDNAIDSICNRGCRYVDAVLNDSDTRQNCTELLKLNADQQRAVFKELSSVMSVYDQTGSCGT